MHFSRNSSRSIVQWALSSKSSNLFLYLPAPTHHNGEEATKSAEFCKLKKKQNLSDQNESKDKTLKTYKFQDSWKDSFPWLEYSHDQGTATGTMTVLTNEKLSEIDNNVNNFVCLFSLSHAYDNRNTQHVSSYDKWQL